MTGVERHAMVVAVDALLSAAPPPEFSEQQRQIWYDGAAKFLTALQDELGVELYAQLEEEAIENDYPWIRTGC
jgi:hypothetical protein